MAPEFQVGAATVAFGLLCSLAASPIALHASPFVAASTPAAETTPAATEIEWSDPEVVLRVRGEKSRPALRPDVSGGLHLLFAAPFPLSSAAELINGVAYQRDTVGRWSEPREISGTSLADPVDQVDLSVSAGGWLHAVWRGKQKRIEYRRAHVSRAAGPGEWISYHRLSAPDTIGARVCAAARGVVHVAWSDLSGTAHYVRMERNGLDVSTPITLFEAVADREAANIPQLAADVHGRVHAVWARHGPAPKWLPHALVYRRSADTGLTWREPVVVAEGEVFDPAVVVSANEVLLLWSETPSIGKRMYSLSTDGGRSWSAPQEIDPRLRGGLYGPSAAVVDSAGTLHVVTSTGKHISHISRRDGHWSEEISTVAKIQPSAAHFERVSAAITRGNQLHVVARRGGRFELYQGTTAAPAVAPGTVPAPDPPTLADLVASTSIPLRLLILLFGSFLIAAFVGGLRAEPQPVWFGWMQSILVAVAAAVVGRWIDPRLEIVFAGLLLLAIVARPHLGLIALIAGSAVSPWTFATGTETELSIGFFLIPILCVVWFFGALRRRDFGILATAPVLALAGLTTAAVLPLIAANQGWIEIRQLAPLPAQLGGLAVFGLSAAAFVVAADWNRNADDLKRLMVLFLAVSSLAASDWLVRELDVVGQVLRQPGAASSLTWTWMVALAFGQVGFNRRLDWRLRSLLALLIVLVFLRGFVGAPGWISGWLPPAIALYGALAIGAPALTGWLTLAGVIVAALLAPSMASFVLGGDNPYSLGTRLDAWRIMGAIIAGQPILGSGPANYYFLTPQYEIRGYAVPFSSHNNYIDIAAQTGILGLLCFVAFAVAVGRRILALRGRCGSGFTNGFFVGATGGFVGTLAAGMLGDWIFPFVYNVGLDGLRTSLPAWTLLGSLLALDRIVDRSQV